MTLEQMKQALLAALAWLLGRKNPPPIAPQSIPSPVPPSSPSTTQPPTLNDIMAAHPYGWCSGPIEERKAMYFLAQQIAKAEGMSLSLTADMVATIWGESGFNQYCVNIKTHDYGIAQFSEKYYLKEYGMTAVQALINPEKCLRIMARNFKAGRQKNWVAYRPNDPAWIANRTRPIA